IDILIQLLQLLVLLLILPQYLMAKALLTAKSNHKMESKKRELFGQIKRLEGASRKVALLELGCGTGANFQFYPPGCMITCLDPNPHFEQFLTKSMNRHLQYEQFVVAPGEDMKQLADGSMDVVVCTLVLCSVQSPRKVLQEVQQVLMPCYFSGSTWAFVWQEVLEPTWKHIGDSCCLVRETWKEFENAQFSDIQMEQQPPLFKWLPGGPHIMERL
uniref:Thiol methyltransferase 1B n=1 Tax=Propithecus coquereli TaxID=379532 RepID=A0A2K6FXP0_PROCO